MSGYVNLPPGGPADGFDMPARPWAVQARAGFYPAAPTALANRLPAAAGREKWAFGTQPDPPPPTLASKITDRPLTPTMPRSSASAPEPATYEQALVELEALVQAMEAGKMPLDQLLASYKRGAQLLQQCRARLQVVEDQVKLLEDGQLKPWAPT